MQFPDDSAQVMYDELKRTGVLSEDFKSRLITLLMSAMSQAYARGVLEGVRKQSTTERKKSNKN